MPTVRSNNPIKAKAARASRFIVRFPFLGRPTLRLKPGAGAKRRIVTCCGDLMSVRRCEVLAMLRPVRLWQQTADHIEINVPLAIEARVKAMHEVSVTLILRSASC